MTTIDFGNYVRAPRISATSGVVLGIRLLRAAPKDARPVELSALASLRDSAKAVQDAVGDRHRTSSSALRPLDRRFDGSWAGLYGRLVSWTRMLDRPEAQRAADLVANLFPQGLQFLTSSYDAEWFHSRMLLSRMQRDGLYDDVVELAGSPFMTGVEQAHAALGDALGLDENTEPDASPGPNLAERIVALAEAIANYGRILSGNVDIGDPASRTRFLSAVAPIDEVRARNRRAGVGNADDGHDQGQDQVDEQAFDGMATPDLKEASEVDDGLDVDSPIPPIDG